MTRRLAACALTAAALLLAACHTEPTRQLPANACASTPACD